MSKSGGGCLEHIWNIYRESQGDRPSIPGISPQLVTGIRPLLPCVVNVKNLDHILGNSIGDDIGVFSNDQLARIDPPSGTADERRFFQAVHRLHDRFNNLPGPVRGTIYSRCPLKLSRAASDQVIIRYRACAGSPQTRPWPLHGAPRARRRRLRSPAGPPPEIQTHHRQTGLPPAGKASAQTGR